jgi:hypothetical protein
MPTATVAFAAPVIAVDLHQAIGYASTGIAEISRRRLHAARKDREHACGRKIFDRPNHMNSLTLLFQRDNLLSRIAPGP